MKWLRQRVCFVGVWGLPLSLQCCCRSIVAAADVVAAVVVAASAYDLRLCALGLACVAVSVLVLEHVCCGVTLCRNMCERR